MGIYNGGFLENGEKYKVKYAIGKLKKGCIIQFTLLNHIHKGFNKKVKYIFLDTEYWIDDLKLTETGKYIGKIGNITHKTYLKNLK